MVSPLEANLLIGDEACGDSCCNISGDTDGWITEFWSRALEDSNGGWFTDMTGGRMGWAEGIGWDGGWPNSFCRETDCWAGRGCSPNSCNINNSSAQTPTAQSTGNVLQMKFIYSTRTEKREDRSYVIYWLFEDCFNGTSRSLGRLRKRYNNILTARHRYINHALKYVYTKREQYYVLHHVTCVN